MLNIIKDVDIMNDIGKYDIILIGTNVYCTLGQGVQRDIALNYPYAREKNLKMRYGDPKRVGTILECKEDGEPTITLLYIIKGYPYRKSLDEDYLNYSALETCLKKVNKLYKGKTVATTMLGCSRFDGNGNKDRVLEIMERTLGDVNVYVYDFFQKSRDEKQVEMLKAEEKIKQTDRELYYRTVKERKRKAEERFKRNGFARY